MADPKTPALLFVCLGNICRSPLAEAAFRQAAAKIGLKAEADSAGTGNWHIGHPPDRRAQLVALRHGTDISGYRARQVAQADFTRFSHIFALDQQNLRDLRAIMPANATAKLSLLMDMVQGCEGRPVADPYHGDEAGFEITWADVSRAANEIAIRLVQGADRAFANDG